MAEQQRPTLRTFLVLARASNLPTVWSNCLAGWLLAGGGPILPLLVVCGAATLLYTGGMFLNDAFDSEFDHQYRRERPIPSGKISTRTVWIAGFAFLVLGIGALSWFGQMTFVLTLLLSASIVVYDAVHKHTVFAPIVMGLCRLFLYLVAGTAVSPSLSGLLMWSAIVLACYIAGLTYIARNESKPGPDRYWPCVLAGVPVVLAILVNDGTFRKWSFICLCLFAVWFAWSLHFILRRTDKNVGAGVSGLLAGIVLVDLLAVAPVFPKFAFAFILLFVGARFFQRFIPAT